MSPCCSPYCPFRGCPDCPYQGGTLPDDEEG